MAIRKNTKNVFDEMLQTVIDMPYEEALRFNKMLCQHLRAEHREKQTETASKFKVGQHVMFYAKKCGHVYGTITVINRVRIKVVTEEGMTWRVSPTLLTTSDRKFSTKRSPRNSSWLD